jgi:hypothetical protein
MKTREEHLAWCKQRALEYCDAGKPEEGVTSMLSDIRKHPETASVLLTNMGIQFMMLGMFKDIREARRFIEGFH